jgi:Ring finger domain/PA domain
MTVPMDNWCEMCQEACHDHPTVCTVCGSGLTCAPPRRPTTATSTTATSGNNNNDNDTTVVTTAAALRSYLGDMRQASQDLREVLGSLRGQVQDLEMLTRNILAHQQQQHQQQQQHPGPLWQPPPNHDLDVTLTRPTSQKVLEQMPRIVLDDKSTLFRQGTLQLQCCYDDDAAVADGTAVAPVTKNFPALIGEFGPIGEHHFHAATLVVASPLTGKGGLTDKTLNDINTARQNQGQNVIVFLQRGDGLTFVQKALLAQKAGASAVIIGNNTSSPWPYVMKDSQNEAETHHLSIPVVMVKEADAKVILHHYNKKDSTTVLACNLHITSQSHDCVVCCERLETTETVVQIPGCAHIFHENCAMAWLKSHNTCPYCRGELPTDDVEYDRERRRQRQQEQQTTQPQSSSGDRLSSWNEYYG